MRLRGDARTRQRPAGAARGMAARAAAGVAGGLLLALALAGPAAATALLPHRAVYALTLDGSKPTGQIEEMHGLIEYELTGDACAGYATDTRQTSESRAGEGKDLRQSVATRAWEDGQGDAYRFATTTDNGDDEPEEVEAKVTREGPDRLQVVVTKPDERSFDLAGHVLMPTQHLVHVLAAAAAGETVLSAKVYDGATDPAKVYDTLTVIGRPRSDGGTLAPAAERALAGHLSYPVSVSYYEPGSVEEAPAYIMSFQLFDNGVVGDLKIDYGTFAVVGRMSAFEALPGSTGCEK